MKTIELNKTNVSICTREEFNAYVKNHEVGSMPLGENPDKLQMLYLFSDSEKKEENPNEKDLFLVVNEDSTNHRVIVSNIMRTLISHTLDDVLGQAEDGNILSQEESDHIAFDMAADLYKLLEEL